MSNGRDRDVAVFTEALQMPAVERTTFLELASAPRYDLKATESDEILCEVFTAVFTWRKLGDNWGSKHPLWTLTPAPLNIPLWMKPENCSANSIEGGKPSSTINCHDVRSPLRARSGRRLPSCPHRFDERDARGEFLPVELNYVLPVR